MAEIEINIDFKLLRQQMKELLNSNMEEEAKEGLHGLLGAIYDLKDELKDDHVEIGVISV